MKKTKRLKTCISAGSRFYKEGKQYAVYVDASGAQFVKGSDGMYDSLTKMSSKFTDGAPKISVVENDSD